MDFVVKKINMDNMRQELEEINFDSCYLQHGLKKHQFLNFKIYNVTPIQATIIKQTALSCDCDCAVNRDVLGNMIENSDCILSGTIAQIEQVTQKLKNQQFSLSKLAQIIENKIPKMTKNKTNIMGILNLSEDSFSHDFKNPFERADEIISQGADIVDIGAESTQPSAKSVDADTQIEKIAPMLDYLSEKDILTSVDTRLASVSDFALKNGAKIINDVSFLNYDTELAQTVLNHGATLVLTHSRGVPETMDDFCNYENVVKTVYFELLEKSQKLIQMGFKSENIILDVGFGFAKNVKQNLELLKHIDEFKSLNFSLLAGISRKRVIKNFAQNKEDIKELDDITSLATFYFAQKHVDTVRVHNVKMAKNAINFAYEIENC